MNDTEQSEADKHNQRVAEPSAPLVSFSPAYFGMVMATGIVSISARLTEMPGIAHALFLFNILIYAMMWLITITRAIRYPKYFFGDMVDHLRGPGFFTVVAGTSILGSQFVVLDSNYEAGVTLLILAITLWIGLTYTVFTGITIKKRKPSLDKGISGGWLLAVVASQSIAVLGALIAAHIGQPYRLELNFLALSMWSWGGMLYIWMISLIFYRYTLFPFSPGDLSPPYWINMGAMAISTLAGSLLIINAPEAPFLHSILPFIKGFTVFYWATGTWWIPMLLILGFWRHVSRRFPLKYDPLYWGAVFPLGMYCASTNRMIEALGFNFLDFLPRVFMYVGLGAWLVTFAGFAFELLRNGFETAKTSKSPEN